MYKITVNGVDYVAPDLATLQQWADEGRIVPSTVIYLVHDQRQVVASQIPGLRIANHFSGRVAPPHATYYPRADYTPVANNLVLAIFSTLCCCLPLGVVSIVYAAQVDGHVHRGDHAAALDSSEKAKNWALASIVLGLIGSVLYALLKAAR